MKVKNLFQMLLTAFIILGSLKSSAQTKPVEISSPEEVAKLKAAVEASPTNFEAHQAYLEKFTTAEEVKSQYEQWMKKYPTVAAIPRAIGDKYGTYSPDAAAYWLKAVALDPKLTDVWQKLSLDQSLRGNKAKEIEYMEKAMASDPQNLEVKMRYVFLYSDDKKLFKQKAFEFVDEYPTSDQTISILNIYGTYSNDKKEKIEVWEKLRSLFPNGKSVIFQVAMMRLADVYTQTGQYEKAIELLEVFNGKGEARLGFAEKLKLAKTLLDVETKIKEGKYAEAKDLIMPVDRQNRQFSFAGGKIVLLKASLLDKSGQTQAAYDSLLVFQGKTPSIEVKDALEKYGLKINRNKEQVKKDILSAIAANAKPATNFELTSYTSGKNVRLEDLKGKVVFLSFWYPACGPCRGEMPHIEQAIKGIDRTKFVYIGVNGLRYQDGFVLPFMNGTKFTFDPLGGTEDMVKSYGVRAYPSNFIIDQEGKIVFSGFMIGSESEDMLTLMLETLIQKS